MGALQNNPLKMGTSSDFPTDRLHRRRPKICWGANPRPSVVGPSKPYRVRRRLLPVNISQGIQIVADGLPDRGPQNLPSRPHVMAGLDVLTLSGKAPANP